MSIVENLFYELLFVLPHYKLVEDFMMVFNEFMDPHYNSFHSLTSHLMVVKKPTKNYNTEGNSQKCKKHSQREKLVVAIFTRVHTKKHIRAFEHGSFLWDRWYPPPMNIDKESTTLIYYTNTTKNGSCFIYNASAYRTKKNSINK